MPETKTERRTLRYDFTASEIHDLSLSLAGKTKELQALEEEKSAVASQYGAKLKEAKAVCNKLSNQVADGWEFREVDCEVKYHHPEQGQKTVIRLDNKKEFVEKMETWEWNLFTQPKDETPEEELEMQENE